MTSYSPGISVVMAVYNGAYYLHESIESVLNQTFDDFEFIIVDDGSTDHSLEIIRSYKDPRIISFYNEHDFITSLNTGLSKAKGRYIARMDADDIMLPRRLSLQYLFMEKHPEIDICGTWMEAFGEHEYLFTTPTYHNDIISQFLQHNPIANPSVIFRRKVIDQLTFNLYKEEYKYAEDYKLWVDLAIKGYCFFNIPEVLLKYRISQTQVTSLHAEQSEQVAIRIQTEYLEEVISFLIKEVPHLKALLSEIIELQNKGYIPWEQVRDVVYTLYRGYLSDDNPWQR